MYLKFIGCILKLHWKEFRESKVTKAMFVGTFRDRVSLSNFYKEIRFLQWKLNK